MISEDEVIAWLSLPRAAIRRDGALSRDEVADAITAYTRNGRELLDEALLLYGHRRVARALALVILGLEELAKVPRLVGAFVNFERGVDPAAWDVFWKAGASHRAKQAVILDYGKLLRGQSDDRVFERWLYRYNAPEGVLESLDSLKQASFYVDLRNDGLDQPSSDEHHAAAFDYLLTFGQERADSFGSWHVTERRSIDWLEMALGHKTPAQWTTHYSMLEIRADMLYQAASLSASLMPQYVPFLGYVDEYRTKTAKKALREALLSLADLLRVRIERSSSLPFYFSRYSGAIELMGFLEPTKILGSDFGKELSGRLTPTGQPNAASQIDGAGSHADFTI